MREDNLVGYRNPGIALPVADALTEVLRRGSRRVIAASSGGRGGGGDRTTLRICLRSTRSRQSEHKRHSDNVVRLRGNRSQRTDYNSAVTDYTYDAVNRLTTISYPDATSATYGYDVLLRLTTATNPTGTVTVAYDNRSRVSSVTDVFGQVVGYAYDANSNRTQLSLNGGTSATYQYDVVNRLTQLTDNASLNTTFAYDATNKLTSRNLPNGVATSYQYDGLDRLTRLTHSKTGNTLADFQYQFNAVNNITQMTDDAGAHDYTYDTRDRLTAATHPNQPNESYTLDDVGNRTSSHQGSSYTYQPFNRLVTANGSSFGYDANGSLTAKTDVSGSWTYSWDYENRLLQASRAGGVTVSYAYDAQGRRVQQTSTTSGTTKFVYDGADLLRDLDSSGATVADYLNGPGIDNKLRQTTGGTSSSFVVDHLGTTRGLADSGGNIVSSTGYDSYGNVTSGSIPSRFTFTGREVDGDAALMYYRARWYDPQLGRFISEDPIGLDGGINQFAYVSNHPQIATDPFGLYEIDVHYYLTYYLARKTGCFTDVQARLIAEYDQLADDDNDHAPGPLRSGRNVAFHAFGTPAQNAARAVELWDLATQGQGSLSHLGIFFHFFQDSYSHRAFAGNANTGHGRAGHSPDHTNGDPTKAMEMARATWDQLNHFGREKGMCCRQQDPDWATVGAFISIGYDLSTKEGRKQDFLHEISDSDLRTKIQVLGVPWRNVNGRSRP
ncbi:MAG: RHS repeat-associated core domain-containing protein [Pyrinomonadaceae bacterium]